MTWLFMAAAFITGAFFGVTVLAAVMLASDLEHREEQRQ